MPCECSELPDVVELDDHPGLARSEELETGDWVRLVRCPSCGQLWSLDEWDKYRSQLAIRIPKREGWRTFDAAPGRRQYLIQSRGGLSDEKCLWQGCEQRRVQGVVYCADHLDRISHPR